MRGRFACWPHTDDSFKPTRWQNAKSLCMFSPIISNSLYNNQAIIHFLWIWKQEMSQGWCNFNNAFIRYGDVSLVKYAMIYEEWMMWPTCDIIIMIIMSVDDLCNHHLINIDHCKITNRIHEIPTGNCNNSIGLLIHGA